LRESRREAELESPCLLHPVSGQCELPEKGSIDVMLGWAPCQPYSILRNGVGVKDCRKHKGYAALFGEVGSIVSLAKQLLPHVHLSEQVMNFAKPYDKKSSHSPKTQFMDDMKAILNEKGQQHFTGVVAVKLDSEVFVEGSRPRWPRHK
jgi:site-specific DNA-cytosine methylase